MAKAKTTQSIETANSSTSPKTKKKTATQWWEYRDQNTWRMKPYSMQTLEELADHIKAWAKLKDSYRINDFYNEHGISKQTFHELMQRCEKLQDAHQYTIERLASRREIGALTRKLDPSTVFRSLAHYCDIDKEQVETRAALIAKYKANLEGSNEQKVIVIERMPSTDTVPEKK